MISITIPCYNEEQRLDFTQLELLFREPRIQLVLVDDGSRDRTPALIEAFAEKQSGRVVARALERHRGKAEAVRHGLTYGIEQGAAYVGYLDADMATPPEEMFALIAAIEATGASVALGSRVRLLGYDIERRTARHYLGRLFATAASFVLDLPVYDTQCGAKMFRVTAPLRVAVKNPFVSRWGFDVELIDRLTHESDNPLQVRDFVEVPLRAWRDRQGSKLSRRAMARSALELASIYLHRRSRRRARRPS